MKKLLFSAALMMGLAAVSFAVTPESDPKSGTPAKTETKASTQASFYWYEVQYDAFGIPFVPASATEEQGERDEVDGDCPNGNAKLCKVGYNSQQTLPISNPQDAPEQITRANQ